MTPFLFELHCLQDLPLESLHERLEELSKSAQVVNSNLRDNLPPNAAWLPTVTSPYSIIQSSCEKVSVALLGLLSDEPGVFRDNTFKKVPIRNILETYSDLHNQLVPNIAHFCLPMTHSSIVRDKELAESMLALHGGKSLIIGGHEHEPYNVLLGDGDDSVRILKAGMDANAASLIDLWFEVGEEDGPFLVEIEADLVEMSGFEPSVVVQKIVDKHMSVVEGLEHEYVIDVATTDVIPPGVLLSSERPRFEQTTVGSVFCQMIKEALEVDVAIINGATIKGGKAYPTGKISYAELKKELPFPAKMVVVPMLRHELQEAIEYSRTGFEDGTDSNAEEVPRRGYLQVDWDYDQTALFGYPDDEIRVAVPRNLLNGFCKNQILMGIGDRLKDEGMFPGPDDYIPAMSIVVRHACKNRWFQIISDMSSFEEFDLNKDGVLDRYEIKTMMEQFLGHEPPDFVVDDMIQAIDQDENGVIDSGEFSFLLAKMEREYSGNRF
jgi:2',3'-cyclic-nucleotide 2'-phosphodiesterase (5'-nucleotidase family)